MDWTGRPEEKPPREYGYFVAGVRDDTADRHGAQSSLMDWGARAEMPDARDHEAPWLPAGAEWSVKRLSAV